MARLLLFIALIFSLQGIGSAAAQDYPTRPVRFIVPFGPAAGADIAARLFADRLTTRWGKPVLVENRPGGDGLVAITAFIGANDDHTLLWSPAGTFAVHPYEHEKLPYDADRDLVPIASVSTIVLAMSAPASLKLSSIGELVSLARATRESSMRLPPTATPISCCLDSLKAPGSTCLRFPTATSCKHRMILLRDASNC